MHNLKSVLKEEADKINDILNEIINNQPRIAETLINSMKYTLLAGGKRIRPILSVMAARAVDGNVNQARRVGAALEMIHSYSLIHDDLPSMDDDRYRRGQLTNHLKFNPGIAILAGDGLLTEAFHYLSELALPPEKLVKIFKTVSQGAGSGGMVGGQVLDLEAEAAPQKLKLSQLKEIHRHKTAALIRSSVLAGAYCGEPNSEEIMALEDYSEYLGLTFQIIDDILDVVGNREKLGKETGSDEEQNKATYTGILGLEKAQAEARAMSESAQNSLEIFGDKAEQLRLLVDYLLERDH